MSATLTELEWNKLLGSSQGEFEVAEVAAPEAIPPDANCRYAARLSREIARLMEQVEGVPNSLSAEQRALINECRKSQALMLGRLRKSLGAWSGQ